MNKHLNDAAFVLGLALAIGFLAWIDWRLLVVLGGLTLTAVAFIRNEALK